MLEKLKPDFFYEDQRGTLTQLVHDGWKQINVITSKKGEIRGNHYHKLNKERFFIVSGKVKVLLEKDNEKEESVFCANDMFEILPMYVHTLECIEDTIFISMYDKGVDSKAGKRDIYVKQEKKILKK